jgi:hypothetical protein
MNELASNMDLIHYLFDALDVLGNFHGELALRLGAHLTVEGSPCPDPCQHLCQSPLHRARMPTRS